VHQKSRSKLFFDYLVSGNIGMRFEISQNLITAVQENPQTSGDPK